MRRENKFSFIFYILVLGALFLITHCSKNNVAPQDAQFVIPDSNISFIQDIEPMLEVRCGSDRGCHSPFDTTNPLLHQELIDRVSLINHRLSTSGEKLVNFKTPGQSILYLMLKYGYPDINYIMPPPPNRPLNSNQVEGIKRWITEGAGE